MVKSYNLPQKTAAEYINPKILQSKILKVRKYCGRKPMDFYLTQNPSGTKKLGEKLAKRILKEKLKKRAFVIGLAGELGGGKTTFLQGFAKGLGIKEKILSPTFVILKRFKIKDLKFKNFYHIDCYRIYKPKHILDLGFKEIISCPQNVIAIEWADKVRKILPKNVIWIKFKFIDKQKRQITIKNFRH